MIAKFDAVLDELRTAGSTVIQLDGPNPDIPKCPGKTPIQADPNIGVSVGTTYNDALDIDQAAVVDGIDKALMKFHLDAVVAPTDGPGCSTDLVHGDHFVLGSSGVGAPGGYLYVQVPARRARW